MTTPIRAGHTCGVARRRADTSGDQLLEPVDPFGALTRQGTTSADTDGDDPEPRDAGARRQRVVVGVALAAAVAVVIASIAQPDDKSSSPSSSVASTSAEPTSTTAFDDTRAAGPVGLFGGAATVGGTLLVGGRNGLRRVDLGTGAVAVDPVLSGWVEVIAQTGSTTIVSREDRLMLRDDRDEGQPFSPLDDDRVLVGRDGDLWIPTSTTPVTQLRSLHDDAVVDVRGLEVAGATTDAIVAVDEDERLLLVDVDDGEREVLDPAPVEVLAVSGTRIAYVPSGCSFACTVTVLDLDSRDTLDINTAGSTDNRGAAFSPDGNRLAMLSYGALTGLTLLDLATGERFHVDINTQGRLEFPPAIADGRIAGRTNIAWTADAGGLVFAASQWSLRFLPFGDSQVATSTGRFASPRSLVMLTQSDSTRPQPLAEAMHAARLLPEPTGLTIAAVTADGPTPMFARLDLDIGVLEAVAIPDTGISTFDYGVSPPVRVEGAWVVTVRGAAWLVADGSDDARFLAPAAAALPAPDGAWLVAPTGDGSGMRVRHLTARGVSQPSPPVFGGYWEAIDAGLLVRLQASPRAPATLVAFDPISGATRDLDIEARGEPGVIAGGSIIAITNYDGCRDEPCPVAVHDTRTGARLLEGEPLFDVRAISPSGRFLVGGDGTGGMTRYDLVGGARTELQIGSDAEFVVADTGFVLAQPFNVEATAPSMRAVLPGAAESYALDIGFATSAFAIG